MSRRAPNEEAMPIANAKSELYCSGITRLVQNLTQRNKCNLIPSAHGTQWVVLSKRSLDIHITLEFKLLLVRGEMVDDAQLSP